MGGGAMQAGHESCITVPSTGVLLFEETRQPGTHIRSQSLPDAATSCPDFSRRSPPPPAFPPPLVGADTLPLHPHSSQPTPEELATGRITNNIHTFVCVCACAHMYTYMSMYTYVHYSTPIASRGLDVSGSTTLLLLTMPLFTQLEKLRLYAHLRNFQ